MMPAVRCLPLVLLLLRSQGTGPVAAAAQEGATEECLKLCNNCFKADRVRVTLVDQC